MKGLNKAKEFLQNCLQDIIDENIDINKLIINKALRGFYKIRAKSHKVLADRMGERNPETYTPVTEYHMFIL